MSAELLAVSSFGFGLAKGIAGFSSKSAQAEAFEADGIRLEAESRREGARIRDEGRRFADEQKLQYIGSGVEIGGSAVVTLAQTDKWAATQAEAVEDRGKAALEFNKRIARIRRREGIASFIAGVGGGIGDAFSVFSFAKVGIGSGSKSGSKSGSGAPGRVAGGRS